MKFWEVSFKIDSLKSQLMHQGQILVLLARAHKQTKLYNCPPDIQRAYVCPYAGPLGISVEYEFQVAQVSCLYGLSYHDLDPAFFT